MLLGLPSSFFFSIAGVFYTVILPIFLMQVLLVLFIPSMLVLGTKPRHVGKAIYCYLLQAVGVFLLSLGAIPALYGVMAEQPYDSKMYLALLLIFAAGGLTFLWHDSMLHDVDATSRAVPEAVYRTAFKLMGYLVALVSCLSILLSMLLSPAPLPTHWWVLPVILFAYGLLLTWCTRDVSHHSFSAALMREPPSRPAHPAAKKSAKKKAK